MGGMKLKVIRINPFKKDDEAHVHTVVASGLAGEEHVEKLKTQLEECGAISFAALI